MTRRTSIAVLLLFALGSLAGRPAGAQDEPWVLRSRATAADPRFFLHADRPGQTLPLRLFDDADFTAVLDSLSEDRFGQVWRGHVAGLEGSSSVLFVMGDRGTLSGTVRTDEQTFEISTEGGVQIIEEIDETHPALNSCGTTDLGPGLGTELIAPETGESTAPEQAGADSVFDLLLVYTQSALGYFGTEQALLDAARLAVEKTNEALANSDVAASVRLVDLRPVSYTESGDTTVDLKRFAAQDGFMDEVHSWRDEVGADFMVLVAEAKPDTCGQSYVGSGDCPTCAFAVLRRDCLKGYTLAHELGHEMGLYHQRGDAGYPGDPASFRYGYAVPGVFHTIQSYPIAGERVIANYSNPSVLFSGLPTGVWFQALDSADAARWINQERTNLEGFRPCRVDCDKAGTQLRRVRLVFHERGKPRDGNTFALMVDAPQTAIAENKPKKAKTVKLDLPQGDHNLWIGLSDLGLVQSRAKYVIRIKQGATFLNGKRKRKGKLRLGAGAIREYGFEVAAPASP